MCWHCLALILYDWTINLGRCLSQLLVSGYPNSTVALGYAAVDLLMGQLVEVSRRSNSCNVFNY